MKGFPGHRGFPSGTGKPPRHSSRKEKPREEEVPEDEMTHAPLTRFKVTCGRSRLKVGEDLVTRGVPTCPECLEAKARAEETARLVRKALEERGTTTDW